MAASIPIHYGVSGKLTPQVGRRYVNTLYDIDSLSVPLFGLTSQVFDLIPDKYSQHPRYPGLYFIDFEEAEGDGLATTLNLRYAGFRNGSTPPPKPSNALSLLSTSITAFLYSSVPGVQPGIFAAPVQVRCPTTTWQWFETSKPPEVPRYKSIVSTVTPWENVVLTSLQQTAVSENPATKSSYEKVIEALSEYRGSLVETYQDYLDEEVVPGRIWRCTCVAIRQPSPNGAIIEIYE